MSFVLYYLFLSRKTVGFQPPVVYYLNQALSGLIFTLPVWVFFQHRYLTFTQMAWTQSTAFFW